MAHIISVANRKGGVGKTTVGLFLATALAHDGKKVIYLDCDSQASAYQYRKFEKDNIYGAEEKEPYKIRFVNPIYLFDELDQARNEYDFIFIDIPRLTHGEGDDKIASVLAMCDTVLIPIKSGELDNLSTIGFLNMIKDIEKYKQEKGYPYRYVAFLSMAGKRPSEDADAKAFMEDLKIPTFQSQLKDVRELAKPYTYESLLKKSKAERERFEPFYKEFLNLFE